MPVMRVDIWSDLVCPWCYVGKRRFEKALARFDKRDELQIVHRSFQLNPAAPRDRTSNRRDMLMQKYQLSPTRAAEMDARMTKTAEAEGLEFHLEGTLTGNTFDAHQLVHLADAHGLQDALVERFYRAYFTVNPQVQRNLAGTDGARLRLGLGVRHSAEHLRSGNARRNQAC